MKDLPPLLISSSGLTAARMSKNQKKYLKCPKIRKNPKYLQRESHLHPLEPGVPVLISRCETGCWSQQAGIRTSWSLLCVKAHISFIILTIKCRVFLQIQSYKLFVLICCILEGEFNNIHTFSFINLSVIRELAHGRK